MILQNVKKYILGFVYETKNVTGVILQYSDKYSIVVLTRDEKCVLHIGPESEKK